MNMNYATYLRVSTQKQGKSGLGLDAQRTMCANFITAHKGNFVAEFSDVESGKNRERKGLWQAIDYCQKNNSSLVIAKLDRMSRDVEFTFKVINTGVDIHFTDMPMVNTMILGVFASVAQYERELVSARTKAALAAKKGQGAKLGAASEKYIQNKLLKNDTIINEEAMMRGETKQMNFLYGKDTQAMFKILRMVFPYACKEDEPSKWAWEDIGTKKRHREQIFRLMQDFRELDGSGKLFAKWDFNMEDSKLRTKLANTLTTFRRSLKTLEARENA